MCKYSISLILTLLLASQSIAYDPPERIWYKGSPDENQGGWTYFHQFTWIADINDDGCDELLISQQPMLRGYGLEDFANRVELYLGGEEISEEPDMVFGPYHERESVGSCISYLGMGLFT